MSAAFTGLAIGTGFERKYAVLKRLGATALPRVGADRRQDAVGAAARARAGRADLRVRAARSPGIRTATRCSSLLLVVLAPLAFGGLGLLLAGTRAGRGHARRGQPGLAGAAVRRRHRDPADQVPGTRVAQVLQYLPSAALSDGLHRGAAGRRSGSRCATGAHPARLGRGRAARRRPVVPMGVSTPVRAEPPAERPRPLAAAAAADRRAGCAGSRSPRCRQRRASSSPAARCG